MKWENVCSKLIFIKSLNLNVQFKILLGMFRRNMMSVDFHI